MDSRSLTSFAITVITAHRFRSSSRLPVAFLQLILSMGLRRLIAEPPAMSCFAEEAAYGSSVIVHATNDFSETFGMHG